MSTFDVLEKGREGRPADLYRFDYGSEIFRFTSSEEAIIFEGAIYSPLELKRSIPSLDPRERRNNRLTITTILSQRPFNDFIGIQPALTLTCTITRVQLDEGLGTGSPEGTALPTVGFVMFEGYATSIDFEGRTCVVNMNPYNEQFSREIPRYKYQSLCNHVLYDSACTIDANLFTQSGLVNGLVGTVINVNGFTGTAFTGGYVKSQSGDDFRLILEHNGDAFTLLLPFNSSILGSTITAYQGCDHSVSTCLSKFNNVENFGGFPLIPGKNPFNQSQFTKS